MTLTDVNFDIIIRSILIRGFVDDALGEKMVKHPRYQAQDVGRMEETPRAFEKHCPETYQLGKVEPTRDLNTVGPVPRPTFRVLDEKGELVAHFHPYGHSECHREDFKKTYEKMQKDIEKAGNDALNSWEKNDDRW